MQLYISAQMKSAATDEPIKGFTQIKTAVPNRCDHTERICASRECIESWSNDWRLYLKRNQIGRDWINRLSLTDDEVSSLMADTFPCYTRLT